MTLFKNQYRVESTRLPGYNYSQPGYYFITICTQYHEHYFGEIIDDKMKFTNLGLSAKKCWFDIPNHFPFVTLDEFVTMPNHIHGIIIIDDLNDIAVETQDFASLPGSLGHGHKFGPQSKNLGSIIRGYKIGVTKYARQNNIDFDWQPRFYDHIIRNDNELNRIREYIRLNPVRWVRDRNNLKNLI